MVSRRTIGTIGGWFATAVMLAGVLYSGSYLLRRGDETKGAREKAERDSQINSEFAQIASGEEEHQRWLAENRKSDAEWEASNQVERAREEAKFKVYVTNLINNVGIPSPYAPRSSPSLSEVTNSP